MSKNKTNGNLNSLLNYRFVKKAKPKLQHDDSNSVSSQDSDETRDSSQSDKQNGESLTQDYWQDENSGPGTTCTYKQLNSPEKCDSTTTTIPETPNSHLTSPGSPVFTSKIKGANKNCIEESDSTTQESSSSSPWLSKDQGKMINGFGTKSKQKPRVKHVLPSLSDSDSQTEEEPEEKQKSPEKSQDYGDMSGYDVDQINTLKQMFPSQDADRVYEVYINSGKDTEKAIDVLISGAVNKKQPTKKRRVIRLDSSDSDASPERPSKRARNAVSSDSQDTEPDSQATIGYQITESQEQETNINFLSESFPNKSRRELFKALEKNNWSMDKAVEALSKAKDKEEDVIDSLKEDDDDYESGNEGANSDDSLEDKDENKSEREMILSFFDEATVEELTIVPGCSKRKAEIIVSERPFGTWEQLGNKFLTTKGITYDIISGCREIIRVRDTIIRLMKKCEKISDDMESIVTYLTRRTDVDDNGDDDAIQITKQPEILNSDLQLKPFQMVGLNWLRIMHTQQLNGILADEMGLGKTIQTIAFIAHLLEEGEEGPHVIIVPSSTIDNWLREFSVWCPAVKVLVYYGSQEERRAVRQSIMIDQEVDFNVILTTYNMATGSVEDRCLFKKFEFHYAIFDEGHMLKNMSSLRYQNLMKIQAERRLLLTGTPLQNNLLELMSLLCFVMPDMFIGKAEHIKRMFSAMTKSGDEKRTKYEAERIAHAKRIIRPFVLRRLKSEVQKQLPQKLDRIIRCELIPDQEEVYHNLVKSFNRQLADTGGKEEVVAKGGASMLMQLRKAANHPLLQRILYNDKKLREMSKQIAREPSHRDRGALPNLIYEDMCVMHDYEIHKLCSHYEKYIGKYKLEPSVIQESGKFRQLDELLPAHKSKGDRVLLFSQFTMIMDIMEEYLQQKSYRYLRLDGSTPVPSRQGLIDEYTKDTDIFIFLLSTKAGGLGINLTAANVVILHDIDFNPYNDKQAEDRCHRVGQTREVQIVRLISKDTVEEAMLRCAQEKLKLEKDITTNEDTDENTSDVASLLKEALSEGKV